MFATCSTILLPKNRIPRIPSPTNYDTSTLSENYCPAKIYQIQIHVPMYGINTNQPPSPLLGWWSRLLHPSTVRAHGKRGKEGRKERREKRSKGRDESLGGRDLGSPFSRIHTARFLSRSPSPHPRPGSCPRGGGWRPPTETPFLPPLTHMPRRTCNMCTRMHVYPSRGTGFSVCVCARVRARETRRRRWGGYALCRPLRSLLTRFANRSLPSPLLLILILILVLLRFLFLAIFFDFLFLEGRERRLRNLSTGLGGRFVDIRGGEGGIWSL